MGTPRQGKGVFNPVSRQIGENITVYSDKKIQFRDTGIFIQSSADGKLTISSDGSGADDIILNGNVTVNNDLTISGSFSYGAVTATSFVNTGTTQLGDAKADTVTIKGSVTGDSTENPDFDFSGSTGTFKSCTGEVTLGGNVTISGSKTFITGTGNITVKGDMSIDAGKDFDMSAGAGTFATGTGAVSLNGDVTVAAGKDIVLSGAGYLQSVIAQITNVKAHDGTSAISIADATGKVTIAGDLAVSGTFEIDDVSVTGDFDIVGEDLQATTGTLNISKSGSMTTIKGTLNADEAVTLDTTLAVAGATTLNANVTLGNQKTDDIKFSGDVIGDGTSNADFDLSASSGNFLSPTGTVTIGPGAVGISGDVTVSANKDVVTSGSGYFQGVNAQLTNIKAHDGAACLDITDSTAALGIAGDVTIATTKDLTFGTGSAIGGVIVNYRDGSGNKSFENIAGTSITLGENTTISGAMTFATGTGAVSLNGSVVLATTKTFTSGTGAAIGGVFTIYSDGSGNKSIEITPGTGIILGDNVSFAGAETFGTGTGLTTIGGDYTLTGHYQAQEFTANAFQYPAPGTDWTPQIDGAHLAASKTTKKIWLPLNFLKIGDEIVSYKLVGDTTESNALTLDCKLVRINKANPLTTTDVTGGGIVQVDADGNFDVEAVLSAVETVATDKQYALEILGTTAVADTVTVMGAEVKVNRKT